MSTAHPSSDGARRVVYVGAGGPIMARAFRTLCRTLRELIDQRSLPRGNFRFELYGTMAGWHEGDRKDLTLIAVETGVAEFVLEDPRRVSYRKSLELLLGADGALILGVDETAYVPSKLYGYALSGKPLLGVFHRPSPAASALTEGSGLGHLITFGEDPAPAHANGAALRQFLHEVLAGAVVDRSRLIEAHLAPAMARRHAELFDACLEVAAG